MPRRARAAAPERPRSAPPHRSPSSAPRSHAAQRPRATSWLPAALLVAAVAIVFHGATRYFFGQDDFAGLARARGMMAAFGAWRWISIVGFFRAMRAVAGLAPAPYHVASLVAHAAAAVLLACWLARRAGAPAAWLGAMTWAAHPAHYTSLYSISSIGDPLATAFALLALLALDRRDRGRWLAVPAFALSLLAKESTLLLPVVALALPGARRDRVIAALGLVALAWPLVLIGHDPYGLAGAGAYAVHPARAVPANLFTYLGWTVHAALPTVHGFSDAADPREFPWGAAALVVWLAGAAWPALRARGWLAAGAMWLAFLIPVLPLPNHTYHYYLTTPLLGAAWCVAALADVAFARRPAWRAWAVAGALAALAVWNGAALVREIETHPFVIAPLRADATVDRERIAGRAIADLRAADLPPGTRLALWSPIALAGAAPGETPYLERNLESALFDGLAVRVMLPQVAEARFERRFSPRPDPWRWAVIRPDGALHVGTSHELERVLPQLAPGVDGPDSTERAGD